MPTPPFTRVQTRKRVGAYICMYFLQNSLINVELLGDQTLAFASCQTLTTNLVPHHQIYLLINIKTNKVCESSLVMHQGVNENINLNPPSESDFDHLMGVPPNQQCNKIKQLACKHAIRFLNPLCMLLQ